MAETSKKVYLTINGLFSSFRDSDGLEVSIIVSEEVYTSESGVMIFSDSEISLTIMVSFKADSTVDSVDFSDLVSQNYTTIMCRWYFFFVL